MFHDLERPGDSYDDYFQGTQLPFGSDDTYVAWLPDTDNLVSLHHLAYKNYANFEIFNISTKKSIFSYSGVIGKVGAGDLTINRKRNFLAVLPQPKIASYYLFDFANLHLIKKTKWYTKKNSSFVAGMDFNPEGTNISLIHGNGRFAVLDVNNVECLFDFDLNQSIDHWFNRTRWQPIFGSSMVAIKYDSSKLWVMDLEKNYSIQPSPYDLQTETYSMDWRCDGNLIVFGDNDHEPKIFDIREGKVTKKYNKLFDSIIWSVKWSSDGTLLGAGSDTEGASVIDFRSDRVIYRASAPDESTYVY